MSSSHSSADRVVPGSSNLPPAIWPATAVIDSANIDASAIANNVVESLNAALAKPDPDAVADLFLPGHGDNNATAFWRDHCVLSWDFHTLTGQSKIRDFLNANQAGAKGLRFQVDNSSALRRPQVAGFKPNGDVKGVQFFVKVENVVGVGRGLAKLVETERGVWKIWTLFTTLEELKGFEETTGSRREQGVQHGERVGRKTWAERRRDEVNFEGTEPQVLIIGAGQAGLTAAARLKMLGVPTLVIDTNRTVGDNWRKRYPQLVLHDAVWYDHMPYIPFPDSWPVFTPKDKLADWFESYVKALDLNVWTTSKLLSKSWSDRDKRWTVTIERSQRDGGPEVRDFRVQHIIMATGHSGKTYMPTIPGMSSFRGNVLCHSGDFLGAQLSLVKRKAVVIGACNSSIDICQDYVEKGYDVTLIQRSSTYVISSDSILKVSLAVLYEEGGPPVEDSDICVWGLPSQVLKSVQADLTQVAAERDKDILQNLEKAGFKTDRGPHGTGIFGKYLQRGGGYYIDVGGAKLIAEGKIKVKHGQEIAEITPKGLKLADGTELEADEIVFATGYENMRTTAKAILGDQLPDKVGDIWGWDSEGEMRTIWRSSGHPGLWFHGGNLAMCRYYSRLVALQIKASLEGLKTSS